MTALYDQADVAEAETIRTCALCSVSLAQRPNESTLVYATRQFCSVRCGALNRRRAVEGPDIPKFCRWCRRPIERLRQHAPARWKNVKDCGPCRNAPLTEKFWRSVRTSDGCWEWIGARSAWKRGLRGYGHVDHERVRYATHRLSWTLHYGTIPGDLIVLHRCDNMACVRPDHLFLGTHGDNVRDAIQKGRLHPGIGQTGKRKSAHVRTV